MPASPAALCTRLLLAIGRCFAVACAAASLLWSPACAQQLVYEEYGFSQGLKNAAINAIHQDRQGYLWIGTMSGLYRGDGAEFRRYSEADGLPNSTIQAILEDQEGQIWIATRTGIAVRKGERFEPAGMGQPVQVYGRSVLDADRQGRIYVAAAQGVFVGSAGRGRYVFRRLAPAGRARGFQAGADALHVSPSGALWVSSGQRLWRIDGAAVEEFGPREGVPWTRWDAFLLDRQGVLWVRGADRLIARPFGAPRFEDRSPGLPPSGFFGSLTLDGDGRLLVPTDNGLFLWDGARWRSFGVGQGLPAQTVSIASLDREGSLWLGLWGAGLVRLLGYPDTESWTAQSGLESSTVSAVVVDPEGHVWAGTDDGVAMLGRDHSAWRRWRVEDGLGGSKVRALAMGPDGSIWAGSFPGGVTHFPASGARPRSFRQAPGAAFDRVNGLLVDQQGRLWVASLEGLFRSVGRAGGSLTAFEKMEPPGATAGDGYFRISGGKGGAVWIASSGGLVRWMGGSWRRYGVRDGLRGAGITHVTEDQDGAVWVAYRDALGVSRLRLGASGAVNSVEHFDSGLSSPTTLLLRVDLSGRVWIGGDDGVDIYDHGRWLRFSRAQGLVAHSCAVDAFFAAPDGSIWIGAARGLTHILRPAEVLRPPAEPVPAAVSWVRFGSRLMDAAQAAGFEAGYRDRSFAAGLAALTFRYRQRVRFRYRLVGSHEHWIETTEREARYPALAPGRYVFEVQALAPGWGFTSKMVQLPFSIRPPFWQAWWFRLLLLGAAAAAGRALWLWRTRAARLQQRRLEAAVRERTRQLRIEKERAAVEREKAVSASRVKSEFLARMSHEIRTPMHGVIGTADLLLRSGLSPEQQELVNLLKESAGVLMNLLNDILDLSKVEAGKLVLQRRPFDLASVAETVAGLMRPIASAKGLRLDLERPPGPMWFEGDPHKIQQVLLNLVSNAVKFTAAGRVQITVALPEAGSGEAGFELRVRDTGRGIPAGRLAEIFAPFVQVEHGAASQAGGTGLGLAICKALVEAMGGSITVQSIPGEGSDFTVRLPLPRVETVPPPAEEPAGPVGPVAARAEARPLHVLVVEDNPINQRMVVQMLAALGHTADVAADGPAAVQKAAGGGFDAILMDIQMPGMDGMSATRAIRGAGCKTPIIALSANVYESDRSACYEAGMSGFLAKPLHLEDLDACLARLDGHL